MTAAGRLSEAGELDDAAREELAEIEDKCSAAIRPFVMRYFPQPASFGQDDGA